VKYDPDTTQFENLYAPSVPARRMGNWLYSMAGWPHF